MTRRTFQLAIGDFAGSDNQKFQGFQGFRRVPKVLEIRGRVAQCVLLVRAMTTAKRYQDLVCWQLADELEQLVFELTATGPASKDFKFRDQIRDSSSSSTRNMAEGFGRFWPKEHAALLRIAKASLMETHDPERPRQA